MTETSISELNETAWIDQYGNPGASIESARRALALARAAEEPLPAAYARQTLAINEARHGQIEVSEREFLDLQAIFSELGDDRGRILAETGLAFVEARRGHAEACQRLLLASGYEAVADLHPVDLFLINNLLATAYLDLGRTEESLRHYYESLNIASQFEDAAIQAIAFTNIGSCQHDIGNSDDALPLLESAYLLVVAHRLEGVLPVVAGNLAQCHMALGQPEAAYRTVALLIRAIAVGDQRFRRNERAFFYTVVAHALIENGDAKTADEFLGKALAEAHEAGDCRVEVHGWWVRGLIERKRGNPEAARRALETAISLLDGIQETYYRIHIHRALAVVLAEFGDWAGAYRYLTIHLELLERSLRQAARARFETLQIRTALTRAAEERDLLQQRQVESESAQRQLSMVNSQLQRRVADIERLERQLREQAIRDPLTGLFNRRYLDAMLPGAIAATESGRPLAVVMIDLDHFKQLNDNYGHPFGDYALSMTAHFLQDRLRASDVCCRYGGEEFCLVMPGTGVADTVRRLRMLLREFNQLEFKQGDIVLIGQSFSAGVTEYILGDDQARLVARADQALYQAKSAGRNRVAAG